MLKNKHWSVEEDRILRECCARNAHMSDMLALLPGRDKLSVIQRARVKRRAGQPFPKRSKIVSVIAVPFSDPLLSRLRDAHGAK